VLFASGFDSTLKVFDYLEKLTQNNANVDLPRYHFDSDSLVFKGYSLYLENDYESDESLAIVQYWLRQIILLENLQINDLID
jgi:hypothetical protein